MVMLCRAPWQKASYRQVANIHRCRHTLFGHYGVTTWRFRLRKRPVDGQRGNRSERFQDEITGTILCRRRIGWWGKRATDADRTMCRCGLSVNKHRMAHNLAVADEHRDLPRIVKPGVQPVDCCDHPMIAALVGAVTKRHPIANLIEAPAANMPACREVS